MKSRSRPAAVFRDITPAQITSYIRAQQWTKTEEKQGSWGVYVRTEADDELVVPYRSDFSDYERRVGDVFENLAIVERRDVSDIILDVIHANRDRVQFSLSGKLLGSGRVPLLSGAKFVGAVRDIVATAARATLEAKAKAFYSGRRNSDVESLLRKIQLSPPQHGSFVFNLETPIPDYLQLSLNTGAGREDIQSAGGETLDPDPPFERRVSVTMAKSLSATLGAVMDAQINGNRAAFSESVSAGVSANLCESLACILSDTPAETFSASFYWSSNRPHPKGINTNISFTRDAADILNEAARSFRIYEPEEDFVLEGFPAMLSAKDKEGGDISKGGTVTVIAPIDLKSRKVAVSLNGDDYSKATEAHREGQVIHCEGDLRKAGRTFQLENCRHFRVLDDTE